MNAREWTNCITDLIDGVEQHLCTSAPKGAHAQLREFRRRVSGVRTAQVRQRYERTLERFLQSAPYLRGAARRYLVPQAVALLKSSRETMKRSALFLASNSPLQPPATRSAYRKKHAGGRVAAAERPRRWAACD